MTGARLRPFIPNGALPLLTVHGLTSPLLTRPKSFDPLKCRALFRPKPPRTWRRADYHRTRTGLQSSGPSTTSPRRAIRSEVVLGDGVQAREDVPGHRLAFECGDGLLNALLADGCGVLGDQAWYSPFFRPSTSFGLVASTPTRSTCTTLPALHQGAAHRGDGVFELVSPALNRATRLPRRSTATRSATDITSGMLC